MIKCLLCQLEDLNWIPNPDVKKFSVLCVCGGRVGRVRGVPETYWQTIPDDLMSSVSDLASKKQRHKRHCSSISGFCNHVHTYACTSEHACLYAHTNKDLPLTHTHTHKRRANTFREVAHPEVGRGQSLYDPN